MARPTEYREEYCSRVVEMGRKGKSKAQIAAGLGISRQTLENWSHANPEFLDAVKEARDLALAWWEDQGQSGLKADKFNATAFIFQMKNRFRDEYADASTLKHTGADGGPVQFANMTEAEIDARLAAALAGSSQSAPAGEEG